MTYELTARADLLAVRASLGNGPANSAPVSALRMFVEGDSKAFNAGRCAERSFLFWALAKSPLALNYDPSADNMAVYGSYSDDRSNLSTAGTDYSLDGAQYPIGLNHPTRLARAYARIDAGCTVALLHIGANDAGFTGDNNSTSTLAWVKKWWGLMKARGCERLALLSIDPRTGVGATNLRRMAGSTRALQKWAEESTEIIFVNNVPSLISPTFSDGFQPTGLASGAAGSVMSDGLHESRVGAFFKGGNVRAGLLRIAPPQGIRSTNSSDTFSSTGDAQYANLMGAICRFTGTGGTDGTSATGTVTGNIPAGWTMSGNLRGLTVAFTDETTHKFNTLLGRADLTVKRMTISGTPSGNDEFMLAPSSAPSVTGILAGIGFTPQVALACNALSGLGHITLQTSLNLGLDSYGQRPTIFSEAIPLPTLDDTFIIQRPFPYNPAGTVTAAAARLRIGYLSGIAISGSIDLFSIDLRQDPATVAAAA